MKTKHWLLLALIAGLFILGCVKEEIVLNELQVTACDAAHEHNTCGRLADLNLISTEGCCSALGKCCKPKFIGYALSDLQAASCEAADENNNCGRLADIGLVTAEQCCSNLGKCCTAQTCTGACKPNACNTYTSCSSGSGTCTTGYCCTGACTTTAACTGACKPNACNTYTSCSSGSGTCTTGYCCTGGCCEAGLELCPDGSCKASCICESGTTRACGKDKGICKKGTQICVSGKWSICQGAVNPQEEKCGDNLDNDCDELIDEDCGCTEGETKECGSDVGVCRKGVQICYQGTFSSACYNETKGSIEICYNGLDDDCDGFTDIQDPDCQVVVSDHCKNSKQDEDETGMDCGGADCDACPEQPQACSYGLIETKCICEEAVRETGYCCNGKYSTSQCIENPADSDSDGLPDDAELKAGTNPYNKDTDGDTLLDGDPAEKEPLCNNDGVCDSRKGYPETTENCPEDCKEPEDGEKQGTWLENSKLLKQFAIVLAAMVLVIVGLSYYVISKLKEGKREEKKPEAQTFFTRTFQVPATARSIYDQARLRIFIRNALAKGYTVAKIKQEALKAGWTEEDIKNTLSSKKTRYKFV